MDSGTATPYSLQMLEERGILFVAPGDAVYGGMLVGENPRVGDLPVNPVKEKHLDNMRSAGKDKTSKLTPPVRFSLERAIEYIDTDELVEATPKNIRLRKRILDANARKRAPKRRHRRGPQQPRVRQGAVGWRVKLRRVDVSSAIDDGTRRPCSRVTSRLTAKPQFAKWRKGKWVIGENPAWLRVSWCPAALR